MYYYGDSVRREFVCVLLVVVGMAGGSWEGGWWLGWWVVVGMAGVSWDGGW